MSEYIELFKFVIRETTNTIALLGSWTLKAIVVLLAIAIPFILVLTFFSMVLILIARIIDAFTPDKTRPGDIVKYKVKGKYGFDDEDNTQGDLPVAKMYYTHTNTKGVKYYLNKKDVELRGGKLQTIYYFSRDLRPEACLMPDGYHVFENPRNGFLTVRREDV